MRVVNGGVSGDTTAGGLARLDWALADKPADHVFLDKYVPLRIMTAIGG